ncbi:MAG: hypothetical protein ACR2IN_03940 [Thermoleophilaceae bacterium]
MALEDDRPDPLIERFDAHLERNNRVLERNTQAFERNTQAFERNTRVWGKTVAAMTAIEESINDMRADIRAHTQATLRMLDRLDGDGQPG